MRSSSQPRARTGGNSVLRWYSRSSSVGKPSSWPSATQRPNGRGASTGSMRASETRTSITRAASA